MTAVTLLLVVLLKNSELRSERAIQEKSVDDERLKRSEQSLRSS